MSLNDFIEYLSRLYDGDVLTPDEISSIDLKASELVDLMKTGEIDYDTQNAIDFYVSFYDGSRYLNPEKTKIIMDYYNIIEEKNSKKFEKENKPKQLIKTRINSDGIISAVTIIELVVIGGILIAFLAIALIKF